MAQRVAWENGWAIYYHEPTVWQERNEHNLMRDFEDEIPGYVNNKRICAELQTLSLKGGQSNLLSDMKTCYQKLIEMQVIGKEEMQLLEAWSQDISSLL